MLIRLMLSLCSILLLSACASSETADCCCTPATAAAAGGAGKKPNVLFILCDDIRYDACGYTGNPYVRTPHIDRLAREGVNFKNTFCTTSLCSPSRASILSGLYAHTHGVMDNFTEYPASMASFPGKLHEAGYTTAYMGKYHMGEENDDPRPGFDFFATHKGQGKYYNTEWRVNGGERKVIKGYYTHTVTDMALNWLKERKPDKPWMLMIGHKAPHSFYTPEPKYEHAFDKVDIQYPKTAFMLDDKPAWIKERLYTWHGIYGPLFEWRKKFPDDSPAAVKDFAAMTRGYWGTILSVDDSVGLLYKHLQDTKQLDNTLIVFMGDNGLLNGEDGMVDKRTMHEPSIRIPLVVRYPKLNPSGYPRVVESMVLTVDMAPSIVELCGAGSMDKVHGKSWVKLLSGSDPDWRKSYLYYYNYEKQFPYTPNIRGVRTDQFAYMRYPHGDGGPDRHLAELYDIKKDPDQTTNLIANPKHAATVKQLQAELARLMKNVGLAEKDPMPIDQGIKKELPDQKIR